MMGRVMRRLHERNAVLFDREEHRPAHVFVQHARTDVAVGRDERELLASGSGGLARADRLQDVEHEHAAIVDDGLHVLRASGTPCSRACPARRLGGDALLLQ